jgi:acetoin utilization protein AcuB
MQDDVLETQFGFSALLRGHICAATARISVKQANANPSIVSNGEQAGRGNGAVTRRFYGTRMGAVSSFGLEARPGWEIHMTIKDCMTANPVVISPDATLPEATELMKKGGFRRLPVVARGDLVGIITDRDVKQAIPSDATSLSVWEINFLIAQIKVREIMTHAPYTVIEDAPIEHAAKLMLEHQIGGLPVVFADRLTGVITTTDLLRAFVECAEITTSAT